MQKIKVLLIGKYGLIGSELRDVLSLDTDIDLRAVSHDYFFASHANNVLDLKNIQKEFIVLYNAGYGNQSHQKDVDEMYKANIDLPEEIFLDCLESKYFAGFIYTGSSSMYGLSRVPMKESTPFAPVTPYAVTKTIGHTRLHALGKKHNKKVITLLPFSVYGENESENRLFKVMMRAFMPGFYPNMLIRSPREVRLIHGNHDWIHVSDYAGVVHRIIRTFKTFPYSVINIGTGIQTENHALVPMFQNVLGNITKNSIILDNAYRKTDSPVWVADTTLLKTICKPSRMVALQDGIQRYFKEQNIYFDNRLNVISHYITNAGTAT